MAGQSSGVQGAAGAGTSAALVPQFAEALDKAGLPSPVKSTLVTAAGTMLGALAGGKQGAGSALSETTNNFLSHTEARQREAARQQLSQCKDESEKMSLTVTPERLRIRVETDERKSVSFPGEWASNFFVDEKGNLKRKDWKDKFYINKLKNLYWEGGEIHERVDDTALFECIEAIKNEAEKKGWEIVWPV